jgi:mycofactocin precursor
MSTEDTAAPEAAPDAREAMAPTDSAAPPADAPAGNAPGPALVEADLLVEDVSIDGMCGVY